VVDLDEKMSVSMEVDVEKGENSGFALVERSSSR
jgi:hypothetical protein